MPKLTDAACQRLKAAPGQRVDYFDAALPGFALRVSGPTPRNPDGRKSWVVFFRIGGQQRRLTIEPGYPALGLAEARQKAREAFQAVERGQDPAARKLAIPREERGPDTVERIVDQFMKRHMEERRRSPGYITDTRRNFDNHVLPHWRGRLIGSITRRDVIELLDHIVDAGTPIAANRVLASISKLFAWAIQRDIVETSPAALVEKPGAERKKTRVLSDAEITLVWRATEALAYPWRPFFRLLIACGQRREETATMRWRDINKGEAVWLLRAEDTKARRDHAVPLSRLALAILAECPQGVGFVFTTRQRRDGNGGEAPISGFSKAKHILDTEVARLAAETGEPVPDAFTIHDFRRTAATGMGRLGVARFVQARILNHSDNQVTGIYDRYEYLPEKRDALDRWAKHIESLVTPPPQLRIVG
jgi:integrase